MVFAESGGDQRITATILDNVNVTVLGKESYSTSFTQVNLTNDWLSISHNLNVPNGIVQVAIMRESDRKAIVPADIEYTDENNLRVYLKNITPLAGDWYIKATP